MFNIHICITAQKIFYFSDGIGRGAPNEYQALAFTTYMTTKSVDTHHKAQYRL